MQSGRIGALRGVRILLLPLTLAVIWLTAVEPSAQQPPDNLRWISISGNQSSGLWRAEFQMGCVPGDSTCQAHEKPRHRVSLTRALRIAGHRSDAGTVSNVRQGRGVPHARGARGLGFWLRSRRLQPAGRSLLDRARLFPGRRPSGRAGLLGRCRGVLRVGGRATAYGGRVGVRRAWGRRGRPFRLGGHRRRCQGPPGRQCRR